MTSASELKSFVDSKRSEMLKSFEDHEREVHSDREEEPKIQLDRCSFREQHHHLLSCLEHTTVSAIWNIDTIEMSANCCNNWYSYWYPVPDRVKQSFVIFDIRAL